MNSFENSENGYSHSSKLRPPASYSVSSSKTLSDVSESDTNSRSMMPPPINNSGSKHKPSGLPEPASKRPTLVERAGEPYRINHAAPPSSKPVNSSVRATTLAGVRHGSSSSHSSRVLSNSTRNTSGSSFASSVGSFTRPSSSHGHNRSQSAFSGRQPGFHASTNGYRPSTALETHQERNGTPKVSYISSPNTSLPVRKVRRHQDHRTDYISYIPSGSTTVSCNSLSRKTSSCINPFREVSITTGMNQMSIQDDSSVELETEVQTRGNVKLFKLPSPSKIPTAVPNSPTTPTAPSLPSPVSLSHSITRRKQKAAAMGKLNTRVAFLNKDSNLSVAWNEHDRSFNDSERLQKVEQMYDYLQQEIKLGKSQVDSAMSEKANLQQQVNLYKTRIEELESMKSQLSTNNTSLQSEVDSLREKQSASKLDIETTRRNYDYEMDDLRRKHRNEVEDMRDDHKRQQDRIRKELQEETDRLLKVHQNELDDLEKRLKKEMEDERQLADRRVQEVNVKLALQKEDAQTAVGSKDREAQELKQELFRKETELEQERALNQGLKSSLTEVQVQASTIQASLDTANGHINHLKSGKEAQSLEFEQMNERMEEAIKSAEEANAKLRAEEMLRRKLHNQIQELKGNIRVFCRVRPPLGGEEEDVAKLSYPDKDEDCKDLVVMGPEQKSALGNVTTAKHPFSFDRIFDPCSQNSDIFEEISQLVQSALDGYNVCIFCYGQTGSGKTYTMSSEDGMIPLAVHQIYDTAKHLEEKGWKYSMEGSFVEVYNENLNDLLGKAEELDKKKHEIRHDMQRGKTTITDVTTVALDSPEAMNSLLQRAMSNRSVAATKANERSSRSHSVFILKLAGENHVTGERSEGTLNLVDLAGSERLNQSQATGDRLKETQNINKSLSCLGDVISALGQGKEGAHIPYRNSKLTYLLQHSLGGNSKTLMFVMISPLQAHLSETITSLKFATKVHNTHIGTAKKQTKVRDG